MGTSPKGRIVVGGARASRPLLGLGVGLGLALALASPVEAQPRSRPSVRPAEQARPLGVYAGVEPGEAQPPPAYRRVVRRQRRGRSLILTWPGFAMVPGGGSRFFVQTTTPLMPEVRNEEGRVVLLFRNTRVHVRNSRRWLETRFFNTPVLRARLERRRRDMAFVLVMRPGVTGVPRVTTEAAPGGNFHYIYIDFPPGEYAPVEPATQPPPAPARPVDPSLDAMEDERPPAR